VDRTAPRSTWTSCSRPQTVIQALNPQDVNALTASMIQICKARRHDRVTDVEDVVVHHRPADNRQVVQQLIDHLNEVLTTLSNDAATSPRRSTNCRSLRRESRDRDPSAPHRVTGQRHGIASRPTHGGTGPVDGNVDQLNRLAPILDDGKAPLDAAIGKMPSNYANTHASVLTAPSSSTTCAACPCASPICRAAPRCSPGSNKTPEGALILMLKYRGHRLIRSGFIGAMVS